MAYRFKLVEELDLHDRLERIRVPTLVLSAERDVLVSDRSMKELCTGIAQTKLVRLQRFGHLAFVTQPARAAEEVHQFLDACRN